MRLALVLFLAFTLPAHAKGGAGKAGHTFGPKKLHFAHVSTPSSNHGAHVYHVKGGVLKAF